jgi:hypothetical protein
MPGRRIAVAHSIQNGGFLPAPFLYTSARALHATANAGSAHGGDTIMNKIIDKGLNRRRMMLATGGAVAGASALLAAPFREEIASKTRELAVSTGVGRGMLSLASAGYDEWLGQVGSTFSLGGRTSVQLVGVRALPTSGTKPRGVRAQAFAAFFDPATRGLSIAPDLIYTATHDVYGPMQIFLASAGTARTPGRLVAVFN